MLNSVYIFYYMKHVGWGFFMKTGFETIEISESLDH